MRYLAAIADRPAADVTLTLNAADAALSPTFSEKLEGESAVQIESGGYVEWTFSADKSGVYEIGLSYCASEGKGRKPQITLELDGHVPYTEASHYELSRVYRDAGPIEQNDKGDDLIPEQVEVERWQNRSLLDTAGLSGRCLCLYLSEGVHTLRLTCESESLYVRTLTLSPGSTVPTDAEKAETYQKEGYRQVEGFFKIYQAETALENPMWCCIRLMTAPVPPPSPTTRSASGATPSAREAGASRECGFPILSTTFLRTAYIT